MTLSQYLEHFGLCADYSLLFDRQRRIFTVYNNQSFAEMADEVKKRGGARPGCGRKAKAFDEKTSEIFHLRLTVDEIEDLREYAIKHDCSMAVAMRARCFPKKRRKLLKK